MKRFFVVLLFCLTLNLTYAQQASMPLSLKDALRIAFEKSPDLKAAEARLEAARGLEKQARSEGGIQLTAAGLLADSSTRTMIPSVSYDLGWFMVPTGARSGGSAGITFPLFTGGKISGSIDSASASRQAEAFRFQAAQIQLAYMVKLAYYQALVAKGQIDVAQDELNENLDALHRTESLLEAGKIPEAELLREKTEVSESKRKLIEAENNFELRKVDLLRILDLDLQTSLALTDKLEETEVAPSDISSLLAEAKMQRPELLAQQKEVSSREALVRSMRGEYSPQVYAFGRVDTLSGSPGQFNGTSFGLIASLPIFDSGRRSGKVEEAEGNLHEAQQTQEALLLDVGREVIQARLNFETAIKLLQEARDAVTSSKEDLRIARLRFESGKAIQLELLDAIAAYTRARLRELDALNAYQTALADLNRAVGTR